MSNDSAYVRDRLDIVDLIHSYAHHADAGDIDAFLGLFADDAEIDIGLPGVRDKATLGSAMSQRPEPAGAVQTRHVMTNLVFREQSATAASGGLYFTLMSSSQGKTTPVVTGEYTFTVGRSGDGWRISRWRAVVDGAADSAASSAAGGRET